MKILVTGGAGYIGSHTVNLLVNAGHQVVVIDDLSTGFRESVHAKADFICGDIKNLKFLEEVFQKNQFRALIHFAAKLVVPESIIDPQGYYQTNVLGSMNLFSVCKQFGVKNIIFSSTAAVYGEPKIEKVGEASVCEPINPYGQSKYLTEHMLKNYCHAHGLKTVILRYFNVAGANVDNSNGQKTKNATHLIKVAAEAATKKRAGVQVFGSDYSTHDGTCIRDYIHVLDLAQAHLAALDYLSAGGESQILNCGYGKGFSVLDVLQTMQKVSGTQFKIEKVQRRKGDPAALIADNSKILKTLNWKPAYADLELICKTAYEWEKLI